MIGYLCMMVMLIVVIAGVSIWLLRPTDGKKMSEKLTCICSVCNNPFETDDATRFLCDDCRYLECKCGALAIMDWGVFSGSQPYYWHIICENGHEMTGGRHDLPDADNQAKQLRDKWISEQ